MNEENKENMQKQKSTEIAIVNSSTIRDKIYVVRGVQVMLDFELAEIYGFTTSAFNQQVKRNIERFDDDFRFQLSREEFETLSISQNVTSIQTKGVKGGRSKLPYAFTESGIYMLMTVLKGETAVMQSKALIRTFRAMKDYIVQNQSLIEQHRYLRMIAESQQQIRDLRNDMQSYEALVMDHDEKLVQVIERLDDTVRKSELSPIMLDFSREDVQREFLFLDGQPMKADAAYISIYAQAKKSVHIVDDYIATKTLHLLQDIQKGVQVTIFSDNTYNKLSASDYTDYQRQFPGRAITFKQTMNKTHDRFIVLDYGTDDERVFHCGPSSKDAGKKLAAITEFSEGDIKKAMHDVITGMLGNQPLSLR